MKIKDIRAKEGYKSYAIAKKLDLKPSSYCEKEQGRRKFTAKEILFLCNFFKVDMNTIDDIK